MEAIQKCIKVAFTFAIFISRIVCGQDGFRVYPYLQNPSPTAMTVLWFSETEIPGQLTYWQQGSDNRITLISHPVYAEALTYSLWESETFFGGMASSAPFRHKIRIEKLKPSSIYNYTVSQNSTHFTSSFRTAPEEDESISFIVYSDSETEPESTGNLANWIDPVSADSRPYLIDQTTGYKNNLQAIRSYKPDLIFIAGDLVESGGEQRDWDEFWRQNSIGQGEQSIGGQIPIMAALGNHEYYEGPYLDRYDQPGSERAVGRFLTYFEAPANKSPNPEQEGRYYFLKYGPVTFIILDLCNNGPNKSIDDTNFYLLGESDAEGGNAPDFSPGSYQYSWLEDRLTESQLNSKFTFVIFHHSPYSSGPHGFPPGETEGTDNQSGYPARILTPLFMKYGVDAVFTGHDEIWERSEITGIEIKPDNSEVNHTLHFYDVGIGGDGLRGPEEGLVNPDQRFLVHTDAPEIWENGVLISGGKHYGHLEVDVIPEDLNTWKAILRPAYIFPLFDPVSSTYSGYERRTYNDEIILTNVSEDPDPYALSRCYPNPFIDETTIEYFLQEPSHIKVQVFDLQGRVIRVLIDTQIDPGYYNVVWDASNESGTKAPSGLYFYRIQTNTGLSETRPLIFIHQ